MTHPLPTAVAADLPRLLFEPSGPSCEADEIRRAIATALRRWPDLHPALERGAEGVQSSGVYHAPAQAEPLALVRPAAGKVFRLVSPSSTGLACTCDGWPPPTRAGPGDGLYCAHILAYLLALYLDRPLVPLPHTPETLWEEAMEELRMQLTRATFDRWLLGSALISEASTPLSLTVAARDRFAREWLTHRLHKVINRTLAAIAGYPVQVRYIDRL